MVKLSSLALKLDAVEVDYEGIALLIRRDSSPEFVEEVRRLTDRKMRSYNRRNAFQQMARDGVIDEINRRAAAKHILVGWSNLEDEDGTEIPYTPEKALEIFEDPRFSGFFEFVMAEAADEANFRVKKREESEKN